MPGAFVKDITAATFQKEVVDTSASTPVLLDFWAAWCGPCRTLGPVLERLAEEFQGAFVLGKVDTEREQDLAYAFGVQGIPFCVLVDRGRPVDGFQGALPEADVRKFLERNGIAAPPKAEAPAPAAVDAASPAGRMQRALAAARAGDEAGVRDLLTGFPEEDPLFGSAERLLRTVGFLAAPLRPDGEPAERALAAAKASLLGRDYPAAMDRILESVAADRTFRNGLARDAMLLCFMLFGEDDERLDDYRRRLATLLY